MHTTTTNGDTYKYTKASTSKKYIENSTNLPITNYTTTYVVSYISNIPTYNKGNITKKTVDKYTLKDENNKEITTTEFKTGKVVKSVETKQYNNLNKNYVLTTVKYDKKDKSTKTSKKVTVKSK